MKKPALVVLCLAIILCMPAAAQKRIQLGPYIAFFISPDDDVKEIYGVQDLIFGGQAGIRIWNGFYFWVSANYLKQISETTFTKDITTLTVLPISFTLRYILPIGKIRPYIGGGYTTLTYKEESDLGISEGNGNGYHVVGGLSFVLNPFLNIDIGALYSEIPVPVFDEEINLGGLQIGFSFLIHF